MNVELISIFSVSILAFLDTMLLSWSRSAIEKNIETSLLKSFFDQDPCHTVCYTFEKQDLFCNKLKVKSELNTKFRWYFIMGGILFLDTLSSSSSSLIMNAFHLEKFLKNLLHYDRGSAQW